MEKPQIAVVTGGSAGVGRAVVRRLAEKGYDVAILARGQEGLDGAVKDVENAGRRGLAVPTDVADHEAVERAADQVERELGPIDVWVNDAFTGSIAFFDEVRPEEYQRITEVTYLGQVNGTRAALARMKPRDRGSIVQVSSALGYQGIPLQSAYCGAKHAIVGFTQSLRIELKHQKSKVSISMVVLPGVNTPQFDWVLHRGIDHHPQPVPPIYQPEVCARGIVYAAQHPRRSMWIGYPTFGTVLGSRFAPALIEWYLAKTNVKAQQAPAYDPPGEQHNTWEPVYGDVGAHGSFDDKAHGSSPLLELSMHRSVAALAWAGVVGAASVAAAGVVRAVR